MLTEPLASTADLTAYICENYPIASELSKARVTKMVYLVDWEAAKKMGRQVTPIQWYFHNFGPYVDDVVMACRSDSRLDVVRTSNIYGDSKEQLQYIGHGNERLSSNVKDLADKVISETSKMYWDGFIKHVYQTDPIKRSNRYSLLNLVEFAKIKSIQHR